MTNPITNPITNPMLKPMKQYFTIQGVGGNGALREEIGRLQLTLHGNIMQYLSAQILQGDSMIKMRFPVGCSTEGEIWMGFARHVDSHSDPEPEDKTLIYRGIFITPYPKSTQASQNKKSAKTSIEYTPNLDSIIMLGEGTWVDPKELVNYLRDNPELARRVYFDEKNRY